MHIKFHTKLIDNLSSSPTSEILRAAALIGNFAYSGIDRVTRIDDMISEAVDCGLDVLSQGEASTIEVRRGHAAARLLHVDLSQADDIVAAAFYRAATIHLMPELCIALLSAELPAAAVEVP